MATLLYYVTGSFLSRFPRHFSPRLRNVTHRAVDFVLLVERGNFVPEESAFNSPNLAFFAPSQLYSTKSGGSFRKS